MDADPRAAGHLRPELESKVVTDRVEGQVKGRRLLQAFEDIRSFERQLADEGVIIVKCFLHISKKEQKRRFDALRGDRSHSLAGDQGRPAAASALR